ncbi:MAG: hypothetical protein CVT76_00620 [Alphaproteobacteria bacterium HGW-Alphaproteobacteria-15]|nr:MAG: hypothetical protein CVT76_00620 [Alphaproteobacteria bacterium HGW-Alphaproteobacteria-15]
MAALLVALLFTTAFAVSIWSMWITIAPRLPYMRALLTGQAVPTLPPAVASRARVQRAALPGVQMGQRRLAA